MPLHTLRDTKMAISGEFPLSPSRETKLKEDYIGYEGALHGDNYAIEISHPATGRKGVFFFYAGSANDLEQSLDFSDGSVARILTPGEIEEGFNSTEIEAGMHGLNPNEWFQE